ncbi:MAG: hypothetical protein KTR22_13720 [Flavobacteriaceae bacterium]|nr:hypothetical protein [Flavobacteriaceae bacterium]
MENYQTPKDSNPLTIIIEPSSDAAFDGPDEIKVTIYHDDNSRSWRKIPVEEISNGIYKAEIDKEMLEDRPIVKMRSNYIVDATQKPNKKLVMQKTTVDYNYDGGTSKDYKSEFGVDDSTYDGGSDDDETFFVIKKIEVTLT